MKFQSEIQYYYNKNEKTFDQKEKIPFREG